MPLRIRCPHCRYVLVVADEAAGDVGFCEYCKRGFTVPIPLRDAPEHTSKDAAGASCPRCRHALAPGAQVCPKCMTNLATGRRPSLWRRARWDSPKTWMIVGGVVVGLIVGVVAANHFYRVYYLPSKNPIKPFEPSVRTEQSGDAEVDSLFTAKTIANRADATNALRRIGADAGAALTRGLQRSLDEGSKSAGSVQNQRAAIRLLAEVGSPLSMETLEHAQRVAALRDDAIRTRALLGDSRVVAEAAEIWIAQLQRVLFAARLDAIQTTDRDVARGEWLRVEWETFERCTDSLRTLGPAGIDAVAGRYWDSWTWLGQTHGEGFSSALFELAKPARDDNVTVGFTTQDETREDVRAARRTLDDIALRSPPAEHAAVILTLGQCTPQYKRLRERHIAALAERIVDCSADDQQRLAWALTKLTGRQFATFSEAKFPREATPDVVTSIVDWARTSNTTTAPVAFKPQNAYPLMPGLTRRVVSSAQQHREALLKRLHGDFATVSDAAAEWVESGLGCPPSVLSLLSPAQHPPDYPAIVAAMIIVAADGEGSARPALQAWHVAADQPAWLRQLAALTLASFAARAGAAIDWPRADEADWPFASDGPDWSVFGAVIAGGGERLIAHVEHAASIATDDRNRLVTAARREMTRRERAKTNASHEQVPP